MSTTARTLHLMVSPVFFGRCTRPANHRDTLQYLREGDERPACREAYTPSPYEGIVDIGLALTRVKERLPHGAFGPWIEAEFGMHLRTAQRFMAVAERFAGKSDTVSLLDPKALYELAAPSTDEAVRDAVEALLVDGQKVTVADQAAALADAKRQLKLLDIEDPRVTAMPRWAEPVRHRGSTAPSALELTSEQNQNRRAGADPPERRSPP